MMLTDAGSEEPLYGSDEPLRPYHSWNTTTTFQKVSLSYSGTDKVGSVGLLGHTKIV